MKKILVTGACGYLGSQLLRSFSEMGEAVHVKILDNFSSGSYTALMNLPSNVRYELVEGDILNGAMVDYAMTGVDTVIHLAGIVKTPMSFGDPNRLEQVNRWGTQNLLESALNKKIKHFVYTSSTAVYGPVMEGKPKEEFRPFGHYANSVFHAEQAVDGYMKRGLPVSVLRLGTIYGLAPVMRFTAVINRLANMAGTRKMLTIFGSGKQKRPFIQVKDAAKAILFSLNNQAKTEGQAFNILENNYSVNQIAKAIQAACPKVKLRFTDQDIRNHFSFDVNINLLQETGWQTQVTLEEAIQEQMECYSAFQ